MSTVVIGWYSSVLITKYLLNQNRGKLRAFPAQLHWGPNCPWRRSTTSWPVVWGWKENIFQAHQALVIGFMIVHYINSLHGSTGSDDDDDNDEEAKRWVILANSQWVWPFSRGRPDSSPWSTGTVPKTNRPPPGTGSWGDFIQVFICILFL